MEVRGFLPGGAGLIFSPWVLCLKKGSGLETWQEVLILIYFDRVD